MDLTPAMRALAGLRPRIFSRPANPALESDDRLVMTASNERHRQEGATMSFIAVKEAKAELAPRLDGQAAEWWSRRSSGEVAHLINECANDIAYGCGRDFEEVKRDVDDELGGYICSSILDRAVEGFVDLEALEDFVTDYVREGEEELAAYANDALGEKGLWRQ